jgi:phosphoribosylformylglycinamidine synthase subunit PurSL
MLPSIMRIQVAARTGITDGRETGILDSVSASGVLIDGASIVDVYIVDGVPGFTQDDARLFFADRVAQQVVVPDGPFYHQPWSLLVEIAYRPGVADPVASTIRDALASRVGPLPADAVVQTARQILLLGSAGVLDGDRASSIAGLFHNPLIQQATVITRTEWDAGQRARARYPVVSVHEIPPVERIDVARLTDDELMSLSRDKLLALNLDEMRAIRDHYSSPEVRARREAGAPDSAATDVELEMIAQTWSEHCKHKIFAARITYSEAGCEPDVIDGLFATYISNTTRQIATDDSFVKSVFHDNAGVIAFDDETLLCFKAETHNSPSALDPYGGAITGIVGVNRDILGTGIGARPIFNTDVLCFGHPDTPDAELPTGLLHPRAVLSGVHRGIVDGGNQSGIPVAAGAFLFDESYVGKPLVFCGTGGILPATVNGEPSWIKHVRPGDLAVMVGGRVGKDGIHGATFSSLGLDESSPTSAVQIGEPITQRKMTDFLMEARDAGLYSGITDNGAGGLSSSLGEMARESGGVEIDLDACPLKYGGLAAWEILVSESQERMSLAVSTDTIDRLLALAARRGVEATVVGRFTDDRQIRVIHRGEVAGEIDLDFLHDGVPQMELAASWPGPRRAPAANDATATPAPLSGAAHEAHAAHPTPAHLRETLLALVSDPNLASKEHLVRQYDHEVQGGSVVKPMCGVRADGPSDGAVLKPRYDSWRGISVTHGINPRYGDVDAYDMAAASVDEAVRAHVALGGDPGRMAALDNFCWPDPVLSDATPDGPFKLAQLVRACRGLADACKAYGLPLISGKDSMKNDSYLGGKKVSIRPTLLVSLLGIVPDIRNALTSSFVTPGDRVLIIGTGRPALGGSAYERLAGGEQGDCPQTNLTANPRFYRAMHTAVTAGLFHSLHDVSDGGLGVALAEAAIGGRLGARVELPGAAAESLTTLFGERTGTFIATCSADHAAEITAIITADVSSAGPAPVVTIADIGEVLAEDRLEVTVGDRPDRAGVQAVSWSLDELVAAWDGLRRMLEGDHPELARPAGGTGSQAGAGAVAEEPPAAKQVATMSEPQAERRRSGSTRPVALLLSGYGINANRELAQAFRTAGAQVEEIHLNDLLAEPDRLDAVQIFALPGGFSYGDHVASGLMLAHRLRDLRTPLDAFRGSGRLILGICNGFQVLTKLGILPDLGGDWEQEVSLVHNDTGRFEDSWVKLTVDETSGSPWLRGISRIQAPIRHGEGRFVVQSPAILDRLKAERRVAVRYDGANPNGSVDAIAGIVDRTGCVLGMMPHPECFLVPQNHPLWPHGGSTGAEQGQAAALFHNAVEHAAGV